MRERIDLAKDTQAGDGDGRETRGQDQIERGLPRTGAKALAARMDLDGAGAGRLLRLRAAHCIQQRNARGENRRGRRLLVLLERRGKRLRRGEQALFEQIEHEFGGELLGIVVRMFQPFAAVSL